MRVKFLLAFLAGAGIVGSLATARGLFTPVKAAPSPTPSPKPVVSLTIAEAPSPNQDERPAGTVIDTIIVHDTESPGVTYASTIANHFCNPRSQVSAHYIIGKRGEVLQCVPDERRAWHAGPSAYKGREHVNDFSIGIELVNAQTGHDPFTAAQYQSLITLTTDLVSRFHIPLERITGHRNVTFFPGIKHDPADNFDWNRYLVGVRLMLDTRQVQRVTPSPAAKL
jgi:N-acetylmuramoyl-L-alanine amidase